MWCRRRKTRCLRQPTLEILLCLALPHLVGTIIGSTQKTPIASRIGQLKQQHPVEAHRPAISSSPSSQPSTARDPEVALLRDIKLHPDSADPLCAYAEFLLRAGRQNPAAQCLSDALNIDPNHSRALCTYGRYLDQRGDVKAAEEKFRSALDVEDRSSPKTAWLRQPVLLIFQTRELDVFSSPPHFLFDLPPCAPARVSSRPQPPRWHCSHLPPPSSRERFPAVRGNSSMRCCDAINPGVRLL